MPAAVLRVSKSRRAPPVELESSACEYRRLSCTAGPLAAPPVPLAAPNGEAAGAPMSPMMLEWMLVRSLVLLVSRSWFRSSTSPVCCSQAARPAAPTARSATVWPAAACTAASVPRSAARSAAAWCWTWPSRTAPAAAAAVEAAWPTCAAPPAGDIAIKASDAAELTQILNPLPPPQKCPLEQVRFARHWYCCGALGCMHWVPAASQAAIALCQPSFTDCQV